MRLRLVRNWRHAHHWWSVRFAGAGAILGAMGAGLVAGFGVYGALQPFWPLLISWIGGMLVCLVVIAGRVIEQRPCVPEHRQIDEWGYYR